MLTREQTGTLTEIINAGVKKAGSVLSELVGRQVRMQVPLLGVTDFTNLHDCIGIDNNLQLVSVCQQFHGTMDGYALLLLSRENGDALTQHLIGEGFDPSAMDVEREEALREVGNILTNSVLGTISNTVGHRFEYQVPVYRQGTLPEIIGFSSCDASCSVGDSHTLYARAQFDIDDERVVGSILILLTSRAFKLLIEMVDGLRFKVQLRQQ
ncbi:hypothetical protein C3F09_02500 [candidate division GN15 bacterium]|uniref:Chemotaxis protein CheC n=1 Tax=candidate division GN15 bacterium TaxID=2072418 RepID=A0A855X680_9BACT|nr:MAG: hypothetical protein C3F09_02500 [candidate division GN15 bacterium]